MRVWYLIVWAVLCWIDGRRLQLVEFTWMLGYKIFYNEHISLALENGFSVCSDRDVCIDMSVQPLLWLQTKSSWHVRIGAMVCGGEEGIAMVIVFKLGFVY